MSFNGQCSWSPTANTQWCRVEHTQLKHSPPLYVVRCSLFSVLDFLGFLGCRYKFKNDGFTSTNAFHKLWKPTVPHFRFPINPGNLECSPHPSFTTQPQQDLNTTEEQHHPLGVVKMETEGPFVKVPIECVSQLFRKTRKTVREKHQNTIDQPSQAVSVVVVVDVDSNLLVHRWDRRKSSAGFVLVQLQRDRAVPCAAVREREKGVECLRSSASTKACAKLAACLYEVLIDASQIYVLLCCCMYVDTSRRHAQQTAAVNSRSRRRRQKITAGGGDYSSQQTTTIA